MKIPSAKSLKTFVWAMIFGFLFVTEAVAQPVTDKILKKMEAHQKALITLRAKVTMVHYDSILQESDVSQGMIVYTHLGEYQRWLRVDLTKPRPESLVLINDRYIIYSPFSARAIAGKIDKSYENVKLYEALAFMRMSSRELRDNYIISYLGNETLKNGVPAFRLTINPRKKLKLYKSADFWVDASGMILQTQVVAPNNDSTTILLSDLNKNSKIHASIFEIKIPENVKIISSDAIGSDYPFFKPDNPKDALKYWADAVFSGKVISASGTGYTFKTERMWKGIADGAQQVAVQSFIRYERCAIKLKTGERYVVFAWNVKIEDKTVLSLMPCSFTSLLADKSGKKVLKEIGAGVAINKNAVRNIKRQPLRRTPKRR